ncbi:FHA domain-containing protein [bacterium]|nr:FHA domain-containing protein [candidate division CSSED10-310 bacterium]
MNVNNLTEFQVILTDPSHKVHVFPLLEIYYTVGNQHNADINVSGLSMRHAELIFESGDWMIRKTNPKAKILYKGYDISLKKLNSGDELMLGQAKMQFNKIEISENAEKHCKYSRFSLVVLFDNQVVASYFLNDGKYLIGRGGSQSDQKIILTDEYISRKHALLEVRSGKIKLKDLGSMNGTYLDETLIEECSLNLPCLLKLGNTRIHIRSLDTISEGYADNNSTRKMVRGSFEN